MTTVTKQVQPSGMTRRQRVILAKGSVTLLVLFILLVYLMPLAYGVITSLKSKQQASDPDAPILPSEVVTYEYEGRMYDVVEVPTDDGIREWALITKGRESSEFIDPDNPEAGLIEWEGRWRTLAPARQLEFQWGNYPRAWDTINFLRLLGYTIMFATVTMIGAVASSALVAYGFSRFRFPFKNVLFIVLISTIILPPAVTLVPTYFFFVQVLGWGGTWWPMIVPQFFANAYNVFLLRQYFMTIPRAMEEAAAIDGAGPFRTFVSVILPQAGPALTAVSLFHFFWAWNEFFSPLIYLAGNPQLYPISVGLTFFNGLYSSEPQLILAASIITMILPLVIFFSAQRVFLQGIVITGVDK